MEYFGRDETGNRCGYCKSPESSLSDGMWAHFLSCQDYQDLLDRGWRRSGKYCYKPIMDKTCCPQYTIRLDVRSPKLRRSQKKVIKHFNKFLTTGVRPTSSSVTKDHSGNNNNNSMDDQVNNDGDAVRLDNRVSGVQPKAPGMDISFSCGLVKGADPSKPKCRKAKEIRKERRSTKASSTNGAPDVSNDQTTMKKSKEKSYEEWIEVPSDAKVKFEVKLVRCCPEDENFISTFEEELSIYKKYQVAIHKDDPEDVDERQFRRFLCDGPLIPVDAEGDDDVDEAPLCGLGAFHQQYYFDGKMVAVGVLDILPNIVSSKYFFYDPEYQFLSLGTYSALREIYFIRSLHRECPSIKYYYMGYYIHSCPKMNYKGSFAPSYLLCPQTYKWKQIEECVVKLDRSKYARLEDDHKIVAETFKATDSLILYNRQAMPFEVFTSFLKNSMEKQEHLETVTEYAHLAGKACKSMLLFRS